MGSTDVTCVQINERGKWHMVADRSVTSWSTVCGQTARSPMRIRSLDLVDSSDRCQTPECKLARAKALGLTT